MIKLSFCITSYYRDIHYVERVLNALSHQTAAPYEILIYCSGIKDIQISKDITINSKIIPIKTIIDNTPQLQTVARNTCAYHSKGDVVSFFDVDDIPHPQKIEIISAYINNYDFLVHSYKTDNNNFSKIDLQKIKYYTNLYIDKNPKSTNLKVVPDRPIHHGHISLKKNIFNTLTYDDDFYYTKPNGQKFCPGEDGRFCQSLINHNFKGIFIDEPLILYT